MVSNSQLESLDVLRALYKADQEGLRSAFAGLGRASDYLKFACNNLLAGTSFFLAEECGGLPLAPPELMSQLKLFHLQQWGKNQRLLREAKRLSDCLSEAGIEFAFLKGIFFSQQYYDSPDARVVGDLDVLIERANLARADLTLRDAGFHRRSRILWTEAATARFTHSFEYRCDDFDLDLHWTVAEHPTYRIDSQRLWRDRRTVEIGRDTFTVVSGECALTTHILGAFRDVELGTSTLRPFADLFRMLEILDEEFDWGGFLERTRSERTFRIAVNILNMAVELFDGRDTAPNLAGQLERHRDVVACHSVREALALAQPSGKTAFRNRYWAWRLYDTSLPQSLYWWTVSLPFRIATSPRRALRSDRAA
jgi:hypothetical protein